jgi:predicted cupin superfamily sugar epimerase
MSDVSVGLTPVEVARRLNLTRQPLGNYLRATWESEVAVPTSVLPPRFRSGSSHARLLSSAIYNLFAGHECVVPLHRLAADEVWHAYGLGNACITVAQFDVATGMMPLSAHARPNPHTSHATRQ